MTCPQCNQQVPAKSLWTRAGLSTVVCPHCQVSLCPKAVCAVVLFLLSFGMGDAVLVLLRRSGVENWLAFMGFFLVFIAVFGVFAPLLLRLRVKGHGGAPHLTGHSA